MSNSEQSYQMVEAQVADVAGTREGSRLLVKRASSDNIFNRHKQRILVFLGIVACAAALIGSVHVSSTSNIANNTSASASDEEAGAAPMQASTKEKIAACGLTSCTSSGCAWDSAPYLCTDGGSTGGCAADAATWGSENGGCTAFCDLSDCADALQKAESGEGADDLPRRCGKCDEKQCSVLAANWSQACGEAAPFVCLSGSATWGCANTELAWASAPATTCGECCDVVGCAGDR